MHDRGFHHLSPSWPAHTFLLSTAKSDKMPFNANINPVGRSYFSQFPEGKAAQGVTGSVSVEKP